MIGMMTNSMTTTTMTIDNDEHMANTAIKMSSSFFDNHLLIITTMSHQGRMCMCLCSWLFFKKNYCDSTLEWIFNTTFIMKFSSFFCWQIDKLAIFFRNKMIKNSWYTYFESNYSVMSCFNKLGKVFFFYWW